MPYYMWMRLFLDKPRASHRQLYLTTNQYIVYIHLYMDHWNAVDRLVAKAILYFAQRVFYLMQKSLLFLFIPWNRGCQSEDFAFQNLRIFYLVPKFCLNSNVFVGITCFAINPKSNNRETTQSAIIASIWCG